jgi:hypothetical protein
MFGLFNKKPNPEEIFAEGTWKIFQGEFDGNPIVVRTNFHLLPFAGDTELTLKISFAIPLNAKVPGGLPEPEENAAIAEIEDEIFGALRSQGSVVEALAITTGTYKEFVFYSKPGIDIKSIHEGLMTRIRSHEVQCIAEMDPDWEIYKEYAPVE